MMPSLLSPAALVWGSPMMLFGAAAVAVPLVVHLMNRRARVRVVLPSVRFLAEADAGRSVVDRHRKWLLMALRCLVVVCLALAFAKPWWGAAGTGAVVGDGSGESVVVVIDASASMQRRVDGVTLFERAKGLAERALAGLDAGGDAADVIVAGGAGGAGGAGRRAAAVYGGVSRNLNGLRAALGSIEATDSRADGAGALRKADAMLEGVGGVKRVLVVSDFQRGEWGGADVGAAVAALVRSGVGVDWVRVGDAGDAGETARMGFNVSIAMPRVEGAADMSAEVWHNSDVRQEVSLELISDGARIDRRVVVVEPSASTMVRFDLPEGDERLRRVTIEIVGRDVQAADDRVYAVVERNSGPAILIVDDGDSDEAGTAGFYLRRALPGAEVIAGGEVSAGRLRGVDVVVLAERGLTGEAAGLIASFVEEGGGLFVIGGKAESAGMLGALRMAGMAIPLPRGVRRAGDDDDEVWRIAEREFDDGELIPGMRIDAETAAAMSSAVFTTILDFEAAPEGAAAVMRFNDDTPALLYARHGAGRVAVAAFGLASDESDLARRAVFVPFVHVLMEGLSGGGERLLSVAGEPIDIVLRSGGLRDDGAEPISSLVMRRPDGSVLAVFADDSGGAGPVRRGLHVRVDRTDRAGHYSVESAERVVAAVAVNIDRREITDEAVSDSELMAFSSRGAESESGAEAEAGVSEGLTEAVGPHRTPLWPAMLGVAALAIFFEAALLTKWKR